MEKIEYKGWHNCYKLCNDSLELVITTDVGPRIIFFGFKGKRNEFIEYENMMGKTGGNEWMIYGGHRLWHAPEQNPRTYQPDNEPIETVWHPSEENTERVSLIQKVEEKTGIRKEIEILISNDIEFVEITHRLCNQNLWAIEVAPWAVTVMPPGGTAILPFPRRGLHEDGELLPSNTISIWPYTNMSDSRWTWGKYCLMLRQDLTAKEPQKAGLMDVPGWSAYTRDNNVFIKTFEYQYDRCYPDLGCNAEVFTNSQMLELETLAPITKLEPKESVELKEKWFLFGNLPEVKSEQDVIDHIFPKIETVR